VAALRALADAHSRGQGAERIILETSGLADPGAILAAIRDDPVLVSHFRVEETLVLVDALHGLAQLADDPLGQAQIGAADRLILTKLSGVAPADLGCLIATLRALNPVARIGAAEHGVAVPVPEVPAQPPLALPRAGAVRPPIRAETLTLDAPVDWAAVSLWLSALLFARGDDLVRIKGVIRTPAGRLLLQTVRRVVQPPEVLPDDDTAQDDFLVVLGHGATADQLCQSLRRFQG
jgi:G3E family GTPase